MLEKGVLVLLAALILLVCQGVQAQVNCDGADPAPAEGVTCPDGYTQIYDGCYYIEVDAKKNWHDAVADCVSRGDRLAWVETTEEQCRLGSVLNDLLNVNPSQHYDVWVGGRRLPGSEVKVLNWLEDHCRAGPEIDVGLFYRPHLDNAGSNEPTVELRWYPNHGWVFNDMPQEMEFPYICELYDQPPAPEVTCPEGYTQVYDGCYYFEVDAKKNWRDAMDDCLGRGDRPAWVETAEEQCRLGLVLNELFDVHYWSGHFDVWIGGRRVRGNEVRDTNWMQDQCTSGPEINADLFYQGHLDNAGGNEPTVELRHYHKHGWVFNDMPEDREFPFICEMYDESSVQEVSCPDGYTASYDTCYYIETETTQNWEGAYADCASRGARLAWVETAEEQCRLGTLLEGLFDVDPGTYFDVWVGGKRLNREVRVLNWIQDECLAGPVVDTDLFYPGHLDNAGGNEPTVELRWYPNEGWLFNDMPADRQFPYVCEISPTGGACDSSEVDALQEELDGVNAELEQALQELAELQSEVYRVQNELDDALAGGEKIMPTASPTATLSDTAYKFTLDINGIEYILETTAMHIALDSDNFCEEYGMKLAQIENQDTLDILAIQLKSIADEGVDLSEIATGERSSVNLDRDIAFEDFNAAGWNCGTLVPDGDTFKMVGKKCQGERAVLCAAVPLYC